jgi:hypothetical protein
MFKFIRKRQLFSQPHSPVRGQRPHLAARLALAGFVAGLLLLAGGGAGASAAAAGLPERPMPPARMTASGCKKGGFFGFPAWYEYLQVETTKNGGCSVNIDSNQPSSYYKIVPLVALAVIDILLRVAGIVAIVFVIYGGVELIISQGNPEKAGKGRGTIINALIGLGITVVATVFVSFVGRSLGGG